MFVAPCLELAACHPCGAWNFKVRGRVVGKFVNPFPWNIPFSVITALPVAYEKKKKFPLSLMKHCDIKADGVEVQLHLFLTWSAPLPIPWDVASVYQLNRKLDWSQSRWVLEQENFFYACSGSKRVVLRMYAVRVSPNLPTARACICFVLLIFFRPISGQYPNITTPSSSVLTLF
jgi:hypothetical protein